MNNDGYNVTEHTGEGKISKINTKKIIKEKSLVYTIIVFIVDQSYENIIFDTLYFFGKIAIIYNYIDIRFLNDNL